MVVQSVKADPTEENHFVTRTVLAEQAKCSGINRNEVGCGAGHTFLLASLSITNYSHRHEQRSSENEAHCVFSLPSSGF